MRLASWYRGGNPHAGTVSADGSEVTPLAVPQPERGVPSLLQLLARAAPMPRTGAAGLPLAVVCPRGITLHPGDVIATATPAGVGMGFKPPHWLCHGDVVRIEIDGIGAIENRFDH